MATLRAVDTNVLLYRISDDPAEGSKRQLAADLLAGRNLALSVQVLGEFYSRATRPKKGAPLSHDDAVGFIEDWRRFPIQATDEALMLHALELRQRYGIRYWDAVVLAAAARIGCRELLTEDLSHGQLYAGVRVVNPFLPAA